MWFIFALCSAFVYSLRGVLEKKLIHHINQFVLGFAIRLFALPFFIIPFAIKPELFIAPWELPGTFWLVVLLVSCISTPIETLFYYRAVKQEELSLALPILSLTPILTIGFGMIALREFPTLLGLLGMVIILLSVYSLKLSHAKEGLFEPIRHLANNPAVRMMGVVALSQGLANILDKTGIINSNLYTYALMNYVTVTMVLFAVAYKYAKRELKSIRQHIKPLWLIGLVIAVYTLLNFAAIAEGQAAYASAVRSSSVFFSIVFGLWIFKENDAKRKLLIGVGLVIGLIIIKLFG